MKESLDCGNGVNLTLRILRARRRQKMVRYFMVRYCGIYIHQRQGKTSMALM